MTKKINGRRLTNEQRDLAECHITLVYKFISRVRPPRHIVEDMISDLYLSLCQSALDFDPNKGQFCSFAWMNFLHKISSQRLLWCKRHLKVPDLATLVHLTKSVDYYEDDSVERNADEELVESLLLRLSDEERFLLMDRFGFRGRQPRHYKSIGKDKGITKQAVHLQIKKTLDHLKTLLR